MFLVDGSHGLHVNPDLPNTAGCLKCISGIDVSPSRKNVFTTPFILSCF